MGEAKWIKTYVNTYDDTPSKMIDAHENRDSIHYVRGRLLALAGKVNRNGELYMTERKPYTIKTLAIEFNRDFEMVKEAIKVLRSLEIIEITEERAFKIKDWEVDQNIEGLERIRRQTNERVAKHRAAKKLEEEKIAENFKKLKEEKVVEELKKSKEVNEENSDKSKRKSSEKDASCDYGEFNNKKEKTSEKSIMRTLIESNEENNFNDETDVINETNETSEVNGICEDDLLEGDIINDNPLKSEVNSILGEVDTGYVINNDDFKGNVTVTEQNKKEKRKNKKNQRESNKKAIDSQKEKKRKENNSLIEFSCDNADFEISSDNGEDLFCESFVTEDSGFDEDLENSSGISDNKVSFINISEIDKDNDYLVTSFKVSEDIYSSEERAKSLLKYCEDTGCIPENITLNALKYAVNTHSKNYVKMAIDKSIEVGKFNMAYINGILKNWKREGYPSKESRGGNINGTNSYGKGNISDTDKFEGFKPNKPRELTEEEREFAEKNLI